METEFRLPELGENVDKGDLVKVLVAVGDVIARDQSVLELETEKATLEVPSSVSGKVRSIHVKEGEQLKVGQLILTVDDSTAGAPPQAGTAQAPPPVATVIPPQRDAEEQGKREPAKSAPPPAEVIPISRPAESLPAPEEAVRPAVAASPSVRRIARELGVDVEAVPGSGPAGRISAEDVKEYVRHLARGRAAPGHVVAEEVRLPDFSRWGAVERQAMRAVRRSTAAHLSHAWSVIPHVTQHDRADITRLDELRERFGKRAEARGGKLTITAIALKIVASALNVFPQFAASVDMSREEIIYKKYCHIGVAVDTDRGLLVPVVRDVDQKNILELSVELSAMAEKARTRKLAAEEMEGGVFTITNLGGIGGTSFTPIVNWPEVAILGMSRAAQEPVFVEGRFEPRLMLPLSLSYDHRLIDGADAARFLRWVAEALQQPFLVPLEG